MKSPGKCPFCGGSAVLAGSVYSKGHGFHPDGTRTGLVLTLRSVFGFAFGPAAQFCAECCMVWSKADARDAATFVEKFASGELKAQLATIHIGAKA
jgi:hypothetical protein